MVEKATKTMLTKIVQVCIVTLLCASIPATTAFQSNSRLTEAYLLKQQSSVSPESTRWALEYNLDEKHALTHTLFQKVARHLRTHTDSNGSRASCSPFLVRRNADTPTIEFNCHDLEYALACDYLSACMGRNTDETKKGGWSMSTLENGGPAKNDTNVHSFQAQRLNWNSVLRAENTVVFNSAGAHMSSILAATSLAALHGLDGAAVGICLNLYVTPANVQMSAPPHTDKQDVVVVQTQGRKRWRVYSPPDSTLKSELDPFARGKGGDSLTVAMLEKEGSELLLDVTLLPGDILFVPSRFPHTTDTLDCYGDEDRGERKFGKEDISMHLTIGLDSHVWAMNYNSMRTLALRVHGVHDVLLGVFDRNMDACAGRVNQLSYDLREGLYSSVDGAIFSVDTTNVHPKAQRERDLFLKERIGTVASNLLAFHERTNLECGHADDVNESLTFDQCLKTVVQFQNVGQKISNAHQDMYVAAVREERTREDEHGGWALNVGDLMTEKRVNRLSIFRVQTYYKRFDELREELRAWGDFQPVQGIREERKVELPMILKGDQVQVQSPIDSSSSFAKVVKVRSDGLFNLIFFDGTQQKGVERNTFTGPHGIGIFI